MYFYISDFVTLAHVGSNLKFLNHEINYKEKIGPTKYSGEKNSDPWNTHEKKLRTHEYPRENFAPTKYPREKILDPQKNPREKNLDSWNINEGTVVRWH